MKNIFGMTVLAFLCFGFLLMMRFPGIASADGLLVKGEDLMSEKPSGYPVAIFGGGCFWCLESEFRALNGVLHTRVGYMGGALENPGYRDITTGQTGHAEVVEVTYDPAQLSYENLVKFFLIKAHDPTQLNRQGVDVGTQYRSEIFYYDQDQRRISEDAIDYVDMNNMYSNPVVTKISPAGTFWEGENYHQQYYEKYKEKNGVDHLRVILKQAKKS